MSNTLTENPPMVPVRKIESTPVVPAKQVRDTATRSPWRWLAITCVLLLISGGIRYWRETQFYGQYLASKTCPFPLSEIPSDLGTWHVVPNSESKLDPETELLAGSSDHIIRDYADSATGEQVTVLVLYGVADSVFGHTPFECYPSAGYQLVGGSPAERQFSIQESATPIRYNSAYFSRSNAGLSEYSEVVWSFWHAGSWWPDVRSRWKLFRAAPAIFKIQIQRRVTAISTEESRCESIVKEIVKEINTRLDRAKAAAANDSKSGKTPSQGAGVEASPVASPG